jgi:hypothetical protein
VLPSTAFKRRPMLARSKLNVTRHGVLDAYVLVCCRRVTKLQSEVSTLQLRFIPTDALRRPISSMSKEAARC